MNVPELMRRESRGPETRNRVDPNAHRRIFTIAAGTERFGLPLDAVQAIFRVSAITPVPLAPPEVLGLTTLRGRILLLASLRRRLGMPDFPARDSMLAIEVGHLDESVGLVIDEVGDVVSVQETALIALPSHVAAERSQLTAATYRISDGVVPLLDIASLLRFSHGADPETPRS